MVDLVDHGEKLTAALLRSWPGIAPPRVPANLGLRPGWPGWGGGWSRLGGRPFPAPPGLWIRRIFRCPPPASAPTNSRGGEGGGRRDGKGPRVGIDNDSRFFQAIGKLRQEGAFPGGSKESRGQAGALDRSPDRRQEKGRRVKLAGPESGTWRHPEEIARLSVRRS